MTSDALDGLVEGLVGSRWRPWYVLELPDRPNEIRIGSARNHARIRSAVRIGAKEGVEIRRAKTKEELRAWYDLYLESLRWHAVPPRVFRFFEAVWDLLEPRGMMRLLLAERSSRNRRELRACTSSRASGAPSKGGSIATTTRRPPARARHTRWTVVPAGSPGPSGSACRCG